MFIPFSPFITAASSPNLKTSVIPFDGYDHALVITDVMEPHERESMESLPVLYVFRKSKESESGLEFTNDFMSTSSLRWRLCNETIRKGKYGYSTDPCVFLKSWAEVKADCWKGSPYLPALHFKHKAEWSTSGGRRMEAVETLGIKVAPPLRQGKEKVIQSQ